MIVHYDVVGYHSLIAAFCLHKQLHVDCGVWAVLNCYHEVDGGIANLHDYCVTVDLICSSVYLLFVCYSV